MRPGKYTRDNGILTREGRGVASATKKPEDVALGALDR
jgi:hypothetical protein